MRKAILTTIILITLILTVYTFPPTCDNKEIIDSMMLREKESSECTDLNYKEPMDRTKTILISNENSNGTRSDPCLQTRSSTSSRNVTLNTSFGIIKFKLYGERAPITTSNFLKYIKAEFYDGLIFHRVIDDFVIQTGGYGPDLVEKNPIYPPIPLETHLELIHINGSVGMAHKRNEPDSATSQFYISETPQSHLDGEFAVFGIVFEGMDVVRAIASVETTTKNWMEDVPVNDVILNSATVEPFNLPPQLENEIPDTFEFDEDSPEGGIGLIDLNNYFTDYYTHQNLQYEIVYEEDVSKLDANITGQFIDFEQKIPDWFGRMEFQVMAIDSGLDEIFGNDDDEECLSNRFNVTVNQTNDAPVIQSIGGKTVVEGHTLKFEGADKAIQDEWFNITIIGNDVDGDTLSYTSNKILSNLNVDSATGVLSFLPTNDDVEMPLNVQIEASDNNGSTPLVDMANISIEVGNINDPPTIDKIGNKTVIPGVPLEFEGIEEVWFNLTVEAFDIDIPVGGDDVLTFGTNLTMMDNFEIDPDTGLISFYPLQKDVDMVGGIHAEIIVEDGNDGKDSCSIIFTAANINNPPPVSSISYIGGVKNLTVVLSAEEVVDEDGDKLVYYWEFGDSSDYYGWEVTHTYLDEGEYTVNLTVSDGNGGESSISEVINVTAPPPVPTPPSVTSKIPGDQSENVTIQTRIEIVFDVEMNRSIDPHTYITIMPAIEWNYEWNNDSKTLVLQPLENLTYLTKYLVIISTGVKDIEDDHLDVSLSWEFTTATAPEHPDGSDDGSGSDTEGGGMLGIGGVLVIVVIIITTIVLVIIIMLLMKKKKRID